MLRQYMGRVCDCIFMGGHSLLIRVCAKKKCILHYVILHWACVWTCQFASLSLCVRESSYGSFFLRFHLGNIFWMRVWVAYSIFVRGERLFFYRISGSLPYPSFHPFLMWLISMLWCRLTITHFSISLPSSIFILFPHFTLPHLISLFSHPIWCLTWV